MGALIMWRFGRRFGLHLVSLSVTGGMGSALVRASCGDAIVSAILRQAVKTHGMVDHGDCQAARFLSNRNPGAPLAHNRFPEQCG